MTMTSVEKTQFTVNRAALQEVAVRLERMAGDLHKVPTWGDMVQSREKRVWAKVSLAAELARDTLALLDGACIECIGSGFIRIRQDDGSIDTELCPSCQGAPA